MSFAELALSTSQSIYIYYTYVCIIPWIQRLLKSLLTLRYI